MAIRYTVTTSSCPHCGKVLKRESSLSILWLLLMVCTCFIALLWVIAIAILNALFKYEGIKMGSPFISCPNCGKIIHTGEAYEWGSIKIEFKRNWAFRNWMRFAYFLGGLVLFSLLVVIGSAINGKSSDIGPLVAFLIIMIISVAIIGWIYYKRKKNLNDDFITVSESDYELIKESWKRIKKSDPELIETEKIKIAGREKIIYPQKVNKVKQQVIEKEETIEIEEDDTDEFIDDYDNEIEESDAEEEIDAPEDEYDEEIEDEKDKDVKPKSPLKNGKHIIVAHKKPKI